MEKNLINLPALLPLLVLDDGVLLPGGVARLETDEAGASMLRAAGAHVAVALRKDAGVHEIGTLARIEQIDGSAVIVSALERVRIDEVDERKPIPQARVQKVEVREAQGTEIEALALEARRLAREIVALMPGISGDLPVRIDAVRDPGALADLLAHYVPAKLEEKLRFLQTSDVGERLKLVVAILARRREVLSVAKDIAGSVQEKVSRAEREHLLRKQLEAIQAELGEDDDGDEAELEKKIEKLGLPAEVLGQVTKELARLRKLPAASPERAVARTWLQWIVDLPWSAQTEDNLEVENARRTLDADHHGLSKVKERILQFLAVRTLRGDLKGPILCLVGPPGVGKTSLGQSVARAMGRKFVRVSLGGVRDEAEIRGHRRTYVGAMPGRIVQAFKRAGTSNPVVMLDEIDKLGAGYMGDPSAALLEVLDPEQNKSFADHYLEVPFDLSRTLFIATANTLETVPAPLRDRMEILDIPSYTLQEKRAIARAHLVPKQLAAHALESEQVSLTDGALERLISGHTREAGVRSLEKRIADVCRAIAVEKASGRLHGPRLIDAGEIEKLLGPDRFQPELRETGGMPGIAAGLAWTPVGGEVLYVEALRMPGKGQLILSGQLGEVMRESARAAMSYVQANAPALGVPEKPLDGWDVHLHVPAGGTPKDGPSAGVTLFTALVSLLSGIPVRGDTAMTGEATLRGRVLPVGGIKEKVLAAHRLGLRRVILPAACAGELREVPQDVREQLEIVLVKRMEEVLDAALERPVLRPHLQAVELQAAA